MDLEYVINERMVIKPFVHMELCYNRELDEIEELIPKYCAFLNLKLGNKTINKVAERILFSFWYTIYTDVSFTQKLLTN